MLRALGVQDSVKSPTFALLEPYTVSSLDFYHFDFYRLKEPGEFGETGFRELFGPGRICAVEWPERAGPRLPTADISITLTVDGDGRLATISTASELGETCLKQAMAEVRSERRRFITAGAGTLVLALTHHEIAFGATLLAVRVWPAEDYTRVTLEHDGPLTFSHFMVRDPAHPLRLVVEIDGLDLTPTLKELVGKIEANDPYIALVRVGQNRPKVARLVIELKEDIKPQVFSLEPVGPYQHRLVMDLYPVNPPDPLLALLREQAARRRASRRLRRSGRMTESSQPTYSASSPS